jgi:hypothetical protein
MKNDRIIEILLIAIFITLLLIFTILYIEFFIIQEDNSNQKTNSNQISTDFSKINVKNQDNIYKFREYEEPTQYRDYYEIERPLKYNSRATHSNKEGTFGNTINTYKVYLKNTDKIGGYFTVRYYFKDYYGKTRTERITQYIPSGKEKSFFFQDVWDNERYYDWDYQVISENKVVYDKCRYNERYNNEIVCY